VGSGNLYFLAKRRKEGSQGPPPRQFASIMIKVMIRIRARDTARTKTKTKARERNENSMSETKEV
jgi:hypothetical protein